MKNPFLDFKKVTLLNREIPLERIVRKNRQVVGELLAAYRCLDQDEVKELCRLLIHSIRFNVYKAFLYSMELPKFLATTLTNAVIVYESSLKLIQGIPYTPDDIEELCAHMGLSKEVDFEQTAPMGLYLSALINASKERCFKLNLQQYQNRLHFLGFRLQEGKHLLAQGDLGNFAGAGLLGGCLEVIGSAGSWSGADMTSGRIRVTGDVLSKTGELMKGGLIQVDGQIQELARSRSGGEIHSSSEEHVTGDP